ncbi:MAG TPA: fibronectin type III domain-containing protein [Bryobacteraceae bacterium]|nr:fibronectin type III domain-containing protein [Bryobacteraceae bacterium]
MAAKFFVRAAIPKAFPSHTCARGIVLAVFTSAILSAAQKPNIPRLLNSVDLNGEAVSAGTSVSVTPDDAGDSMAVSPSFGSGVTQSFTFSYTSGNQAQQHFFFNNSLTGNGACYLIYDQPSNTLYMVNDQGTAVSQSATPGAPGVLSSSQCSVPASSASVQISGSTVNIGVTITFSASFAGAQNIYANIANTSYVEGNWQQIGTWTVPATVDNSITATPSAGSGITQTFAFSYTSTSQAQDHVFFSNSLTGNGSCYLIYDQPSNTLEIANDQGDAVSQSAALGSSGVLSNSQCSVPAGSASASISGNTVNLRVTITFNASFAGAHNIYANIANASYVEGTWQQIGTWTVPAVVNDSITMTPSFGSGTTQTFAFNYTSTNQVQEHFFFNNSFTGSGSCYLFYDQPSNTLSITNDQGNAVNQSATPGSSGVLSNSQCSVPVSNASVAVLGNTVAISVTITFNSSFAGTQNVYANRVNTSYVEGAWQQIGTWTVPASGPPVHSVTLNWMVSSSPNVIGYYVYRGSTSGGPYTRLSGSLDAGTGYTDSSVQGGQTYFYVVTAVNNVGVESGYSTEVQVTIPSP